MRPEIKERLDLLFKEIAGIRAYLKHLEEVAEDIQKYVGEDDNE